MAKITKTSNAVAVNEDESTVLDDKEQTKVDGKSDGSKSNNAEKRTFSIVKITRDGETETFAGGKYQSITPAGATRKAANQACKTLYGSEENCVIEITMKDITKNHSNKEYTYQAIRTKNTKQVPFVGNSGVKVQIPFEYSMKLKSLRQKKGGVVVEKDVETETTETATDAAV